MGYGLARIPPQGVTVLDSAPVRPVFVDPSGRRRRVLHVVTVAAAAATLGYLSLVVLAALGSSPPPLARLPVPPALQPDETLNGGLAPEDDVARPPANADNAAKAANATNADGIGNSRLRSSGSKTRRATCCRRSR
jgi:hypothetical protein